MTGRTAVVAGISASAFGGVHMNKVSLASAGNFSEMSHPFP